MNKILRILTISSCLFFFSEVHSVSKRQYKTEYNEISSSNIRIILDPKRVTVISSLITAPVRAINKRMGESFEKDFILIELDDEIFLARFKETQAHQQKAALKLSAMEQLFKDDSASLFELKEAEALLAEAEATLSIAKKDLDACKINAPYSGKVVAIAYEEYELAHKDKPLIEIIDDSTLVAKLLISSEYLDQLKIGNVLEVSIEETKSKEKAVIQRIGAVIDSTSSTIKVEAEIDNSDKHLKAGMTGRTSIEK
jgi:membrane fusion protein (multidrug efflux system)